LYTKVALEKQVKLWTNCSPVSFVVTGLIETQALPFFGIQTAELTLDEKAELLLVDQG